MSFVILRKRGDHKRENSKYDVNIMLDKKFECKCMYSHLPNKWGGSNNRGGWKVSKMGRVKMHLINRERGKFPKRGGRRST